MFKDIHLSIDNNNNKVNFGYAIDKDKIIIKTIDELQIGNILKIFYDENIYNIKLNKNTKFTDGKNGEIFINLDIKELSFSLTPKKNYFVKTIYKYINKLIDKDTLINEINVFINSKTGKKYINDLNHLLETIENRDMNIEDLITNNEDEYERIFNLVTHNQTYIEIAQNMSDLELMLLITSYIFVPSIPKIDQDYFNDLVNVAKDYDNALENIWRLGMNFDGKGYNFDLLDDFFVNSKNIWYLGEYINGIQQINQEKIVNKILGTKDKEFIKQVVEDELILYNLDKEYKIILESNI